MIDYPMVARLAATVALLAVWARLSLKNGKMEAVPWQLIVALLAAWGVQLAPDVLSVIGRAGG